MKSEELWQEVLASTVAADRHVASRNHDRASLLGRQAHEIQRDRGIERERLPSAFIRFGAIDREIGNLCDRDLELLNRVGRDCRRHPAALANQSRAADRAEITPSMLIRACEGAVSGPESLHAAAPTTTVPPTTKLAILL